MIAAEHFCGIFQPNTCVGFGGVIRCSLLRSHTSSTLLTGSALGFRLVIVWQQAPAFTNPEILVMTGAGPPGIHQTMCMPGINSTLGITGLPSDANVGSSNSFPRRRHSYGRSARAAVLMITRMQLKKLV